MITAEFGFIKPPHTDAFAMSALPIVTAPPLIGQPVFTPVGQFAVVDHGSSSNTSGGSLTLTPISNIPAGSLIVVVVNEGGNNGGVPGTLTDSAGNSYSTAGHKSPNNLSVDGTVSVFYVLSCGALSSTQTITYNKQGSSATTMTVVSTTYTGTLSLDQNPAATSGASNSPSNTSSIPSGSNMLWIGCAGMKPWASSDNYTHTPGWAEGPDVLGSSGGACGQGGGHLVATDGLAKTFAPTITSNRAWAAFIIGFKAA